MRPTKLSIVFGVALAITSAGCGSVPSRPPASSDIDVYFPLNNLTVNYRKDRLFFLFPVGPDFFECLAPQDYAPVYQRESNGSLSFLGSLGTGSVKLQRAEYRYIYDRKSIASVRTNFQYRSTSEQAFAERAHGKITMPDGSVILASMSPAPAPSQNSSTLDLEWLAPGGEIKNGFDRFSVTLLIGYGARFTVDWVQSQAGASLSKIDAIPARGSDAASIGTVSFETLGLNGAWTSKFRPQSLELSADAISDMRQTVDQVVNEAGRLIESGELKPAQLEVRPEVLGVIIPQIHYSTQLVGELRAILAENAIEWRHCDRLSIKER